jgi:hypothetical protein
LTLAGNLDVKISLSPTLTAEENPCLGALEKLEEKEGESKGKKKKEKKKESIPE